MRDALLNVLQDTEFVEALIASFVIILLIKIK